MHDDTVPALLDLTSDELSACPCSLLPLHVVAELSCFDALWWVTPMSRLVWLKLIAIVALFSLLFFHQTLVAFILAGHFTVYCFVIYLLHIRSVDYK